MSRLGSFPLRTAIASLESYGGNPKIVLDPFCGKGTSLLAARLLGSEAYGLDTGPEAVVCSRAKLTTITLAEAEAYLKKLRASRVSLSRVPDDVKSFFHTKTLQQIIAVNRQLDESIEGAGPDKEIATTLQATLLGILHGHASYSLSISSAHAYAMAPGYVRRYAAKNGLEAPVRDVKACLLAKLSRCLVGPAHPLVRSSVKLGKAQNTTELFPELVNRVDCILTSPPYLSSHTYAKDNWLRQWLLGFDYREISCDYLQTSSLIRYEQEMTQVLASMVKVLRPGGRLICILGKGRLGRASNGQVNLKSTFKRLLRQSEPAMKLELIATEYIKNHRRCLSALKSTNGHNNRVRAEHLIVASKPE
jgi:hypothetical protein